MDPTDSNHDSNDVGLRITYRKKSEIIMLNDLDTKVGQKVTFVGRLKKMGDEDTPHFFELMTMQAVEGEVRDVEHF